jgi:hypothetical protein
MDQLTPSIKQRYSISHCILLRTKYFIYSCHKNIGLYFINYKIKMILPTVLVVILAILYFLFNNPNYIRTNELGSGPQIVWKACATNMTDNPSIKPTVVYAKLLIPTEAKRTTFSVHGNEKRAEFVEVLDIFDKEGNHYDECESFVHKKGQFKYKKGEIAKADRYNENEQSYSTHGINVYMYQDECDSWFEWFDNRTEY